VPHWCVRLHGSPERLRGSAKVCLAGSSIVLALTLVWMTGFMSGVVIYAIVRRAKQKGTAGGKPNSPLAGK
jgi:hypothetical protein